MNTFPKINLTEEMTHAPGKTDRANGANFYSDLQYSFEKKYPEFLRYLTTDELLVFEEGVQFYKHETARDRALKVMRHSDVVDKVPEEVLNAYYDRVREEFEIKRREAQKKKKQHAGHELGAREFTLTYSPKWFSDEEARKQMTRAINRLIYYYKDGDQRITRMRAIGEVGTNGLSHVHCFYQLLGGVKISNKNFKRAYPPWDTNVKQGPTGHKGGHHATVKHTADFLGYIEKEVTNAWLDISVGEDDPI